MALRIRNGNFHYRFEVDGHEWSGDTGLVATERNREAALAVAVKARAAVHQGEGHTLRVQVIPFSKAAEKFIVACQAQHRKKPNTHKRISGSMSSLKVFFGRRPVNSITAGDVIDYKAWRATERKEGNVVIAPVKDITIRHDLHALSKFFKYAIKKNWRRNNPVDSEDIPSDEGAVRDHIFTPNEEILYFANAKPKLADLCHLMLYQGCRPEELLVSRVEHVDLARRYIRIEKSKSNAGERTLRLRPESLEILTRLVALSEHGWLFASERSGAKNLSLSTCENWHVKAREATGIACVIYDWRHTFATRAILAGMSPATLKDVLGHKDLRSVMRYVHLTQQDQDRAMDELSKPKAEPDQNRTKLEITVTQ